MKEQRVGFETGTTGSVKEKMEYVALRKITKEMTPAEKKGAELWNEMVEIVRSYGRMEDKK